MPELRRPSTTHPEWSVLNRIGASAVNWTRWHRLKRCSPPPFEGDPGYDGLIAQSQQQSEISWAVREMIGPTPRQIGDRFSSHDHLGALWGRCLMFIISGRAKKSQALGGSGSTVSVIGRRHCILMSSTVAGRSREDHLDDRGAESRRRSTIWCMNWAALSCGTRASGGSRSTRPRTLYSDPRAVGGAAPRSKRR